MKDTNRCNLRFPNGCPLMKSGCIPFHMSYWWYMDVFVYFSHHLVTIPPVGWIDAAHQHGVSVLGTFITEDTDGTKIWDKILSNTECMEAVVSKLTNIAQKYNFEGWLLNVENEIQYDQLENLDNFISLLYRSLKKNIGSRSQLIWYDAVIRSSGRLKWQDELNTLNRSFFDRCDGIFLNYTWTESSLRATVAELSKGHSSDSTSSELHMPSMSTIFVGIDVYGRGCLGGGGFNCAEPLGLIRKYGLSVAIFAPGWIYEKLPPKELDENECKFWGSICDQLFCRQLQCLPIETSFSVGCIADPGGAKSFNLRSLQLQPHFLCQRDAQFAKNGEITNYFDESSHTSALCIRWLEAGTFEIRLFCTKLSMGDEFYVTFSHKMLGVPPSKLWFIYWSQKDDENKENRHLEEIELATYETSNADLVEPVAWNEETLTLEAERKTHLTGFGLLVEASESMGSLLFTNLFMDYS